MQQIQQVEKPEEHVEQPLAKGKVKNLKRVEAGKKGAAARWAKRERQKKESKKQDELKEDIPKNQKIRLRSNKYQKIIRSHKGYILFRYWQYQALLDYIC